MALLNALTADANTVLNSLGLNSWQLQTGKYHGYTFHTITDTLAELNKNFNPIAGVIDSVTNFLGSTADQPIPYGTNTQLMSTRRAGRKKYVVNPLPNGLDNFQYMGFHGDAISFNVLIWGQSYDTLIRKLQSVFLNDNLYVGTPDYRVLEHPVLGRITNCHFLSFEEIYSSERWRASIVTLNFQTEAPITYPIVQPPSNVFNSFLNIVSGVYNIVNSVLNAWNNISVIINKYFGANVSLSGSYNSAISLIAGGSLLLGAQASVLSARDTGVKTTQILLTNLAPPKANYPNISGIATPNIDSQALNYYNNNFSPNDVNNLLSYNLKTIKKAIDTLLSLSENQFYDTINNLNSLASLINQLGYSLLSNYYGQIKSYEAPTDLTLYEVCVNNNLDYATSLPNIIQLNKNKILWNSLIRRGSIVLLPNK